MLRRVEDQCLRRPCAAANLRHGDGSEFGRTIPLAAIGADSHAPHRQHWHRSRWLRRAPREERIHQSALAFARSLA